LNQINFLIPVYNDWKSLELLLKKINNELSRKKIFCNVVIIDDCSSERPSVYTKELSYLRKINILRLKKNVGSQKAIGLGLKHISKIKKRSTILIMDSDGEDDPKQINKMIENAEKFPNYVITSNRTKRKESLLIRFLYKSHLILTFIFTGKWISFGNYTSLDSKNLKSLFKDGSVWFAYPAAVIKNNNIKRLFAARKKRYYGSSKLTLYKLFFHSLKIISVFDLRVFIFSLTYISILQIIFYNTNKLFFYFFTILIILLNILILFTKFFINRIKIDYNKNWVNYLKSIKG